MVLALAACGRRDNTVTDQGPAAIYEKGRSAMESSNYPGAIQYFKALEARYPFSPVSGPVLSPKLAVFTPIAPSIETYRLHSGVSRG